MREIVFILSLECECGVGSSGEHLLILIQGKTIHMGHEITNRVFCTSIEQHLLYGMMVS
jgi:hypothetical protein